MSARICRHGVWQVGVLRAGVLQAGALHVQVMLVGVLVLMLLAVWPGVAGSSVPGVADSEHRLLRQIRLGETLYRDDVVLDAVARLYRIRANHPQGLLAELRIAARLDRLAEARQLLERLQTTSPESPEAHTGYVLLKLTTTDGVAALTQGRLYSAVGRVEEALAIYDALLEGAYPTADLTLEYWQLFARQPGRRPEAIMRLQEALDEYPTHGSTLMSVASMLFSEDRPEEALQYLRRLAALDTHREAAATREFAYLSTLDVSEENRDRWQNFVDTYAGLDIVRRGQEELARFDHKLNDPAWQAGRQGVALIEQGEGARALPLLQQAVAGWPDDVEFLGSLGVAYLRTGDRNRALYYFEQARDKEPRVDRTYRWVSLIRSTRYWMLLEQASEAAGRGDWARAGRLYQQASQQQPDHPFALVGQGDVAMAMGRPDQAWAYYRQALQREPDSGVARRGVLRYLESLPPEEALRQLDALPALQAPLFDDARRRLTLRLLTRRASAAIDARQWDEAGLLLLEAQYLDPDDPWLSYRLATVLRDQGRPDEGLRTFHQHLNRHPDAPASRYAHGLLLASVNRWQDVIDTLAVIPRSQWDSRMLELEGRVLDMQALARASALREAGRNDEAYAALTQRAESVRVRLQQAQWLYDDGQFDAALHHYEAVLQMDPNNFDARLGQLEVWLVQGKAVPVRAALSRPGFTLDGQPTTVYRRVAALWAGLNEPERAKAILRGRAADLSEPEPLLYRDLARLEQTDNPDQALDYYAVAMRDAGLLTTDAVQPLRDNVAFTRAMHGKETDGWMERGLRREADTLYQGRTPVLSVHNDSWWRRDGTPGLSRLYANTTMLQLDYPVRHGRGFLRVDHVRMDAGTLETDADGVYRGEFGSCSFAASSTGAGWQPRECRHGLSQRANGTSVAVGWQGERVSFDLGTTPLGFPVTNWAGGISYSGKTGPTGWRLTASRRPMSNSLLSFAGARDPATGVKWGGVMATGVALGLSWDQGEANGVWADISHHRLTGRNVETNHRTRLMGGYYRRLINKPDESLSAGVNLMYWRYRKDLGDYSFGQGGYYSPGRYTSVSLPVSYARRSADWTFMLEGAVSRSFARSARGDGDSSRGTGYRVGGYAERRLNNHWVLGAAIDYRRSKDYSPSHFMLYVRYSFQPWQGPLPLRPDPMLPYAEFK